MTRGILCMQVGHTQIGKKKKNFTPATSGPKNMQENSQIMANFNTQQNSIIYQLYNPFFLSLLKLFFDISLTAMVTWLTHDTSAEKGRINSSFLNLQKIWREKKLMAIGPFFSVLDIPFPYSLIPYSQFTLVGKW